MPVYDLETGRIIGRVRRLIVDPDERRIAALLLAARLGKEAPCLPFRELHAIGDHAVTVRGTDSLAPLSQHPELQELLRARRRVCPAPILTEGGRFLGDVDEFTVDPKTGRIESLLLSGGLIRDLFRGQAVLPADLVLTVGEDAIIVRDDAAALLAPARTESAAGREARGTGLEPKGEQASVDGVDERRSNSPDRHATPAERLRAAFRSWRPRRTPPPPSEPESPHDFPDTRATAPAAAAPARDPEAEPPAPGGAPGAG